MRLSLDEFLGLSEAERNSGKVVYCIEEDRHVITNGKVFGMIEAGGRSIAMWDSHIRLPYQRMYEEEINERQNKSMAQSTAETISERPAVEKLVKEAEVKLNALVNEGEQKLKSVENDGAEKLATVVKEGEAKVEVHRSTSRKGRTNRRRV